MYVTHVSGFTEMVFPPSVSIAGIMAGLELLDHTRGNTPDSDTA